MFTSTFYRILFLILMIPGMISCGGKKKAPITSQKSVKPQNLQIQGYLGDYLEVVDGTYEATRNQSGIFSWVIKVKIKVKKAYREADYGLKDGNDGPLKLDFFNDKQTPITDFDNLKSSYQDDSILKDLLAKGKGETWVTFTKFHSGTAEEYPDDIASFTISSDKLEEQVYSNSTSSETNDLSADADPDKLLDQYEKIVDDYVAMANSMKQDDPASMLQNTAQYMADYQKFGEELQKHKGQFTPAQVSRMVKIQAKMAKVMAK